MDDALFEKLLKETMEPQFRMKHLVNYARREDMSPEGTLSLMMQDDGDIILVARGQDHLETEYREAQVEFCTCGAGGGHSPRVRKALIALACAITLDNQESPIGKPDIDRASELHTGMLKGASQETPGPFTKDLPENER